MALIPCVKHKDDTGPPRCSLDKLKPRELYRCSSSYTVYMKVAVHPKAKAGRSKKSAEFYEDTCFGVLLTSTKEDSKNIGKVFPFSPTTKVVRCRFTGVCNRDSGFIEVEDDE